MRVKRAALTDALTGQFDDHHAELARILLDQIDTLTGQIDHLTLLIDQLIAAIPNAQPPVTEHSQHGDGSHTPQDPAALAAIDRLDESGIRAVFARGTAKPPVTPDATPYYKIPFPRDELRRLRTGRFASDDGRLLLAMAILGPDWGEYDVAVHDIRLAREYGRRVDELSS